MEKKVKRYKILFVDDDANFLQSLARSLRRMSAEWDLRFASSGSMALDILDAEVCDAVVTDFKMPEMDGLELLSTLKERYPDVVRVLFTGQSDDSLFGELVGISHEYIAKPCEISVLTEKIKGAIDRIRGRVE